MARSAKMTIVEAEEIVPVGSLDPNNIHLPGIFVQRVVQATSEKQIEIKTLRNDAGQSAAALGKADAKARRERIVKRAALELHEGDYVNLGIGMRESPHCFEDLHGLIFIIAALAPSFVKPGTIIHMQSENGILGSAGSISYTSLLTSVVEWVLILPRKKSTAI